MTNGNIRTVLGRLAPGLLMCFILAATPASASFEQSGPLYLSAGAVSGAQRMLVHDGYLRSGDFARGELDGPTTEAIRAFQADHFIPQHGQLDPETMGMLSDHRPTGVAARTKAGASAARPAGGPQEAPVETARLRRSMPATASPIPLMTGLGGFLLASGLALVLWRRR
jgi:putative peptidoglycan binding protein